jgi:GMP synthase (glutamine-hydrolysing)
MICRVIYHVSFEDLGLWEEALAGRGFTLIRHQAGLEPPAPGDWLTADLGVILGGPIGVNDAGAYPWIEGELKLTADRLAAGRPLLGICLGAQMMARALGAPVYAGAKKEIGWSALALTGEGLRSPLRHLRDTPVLHWHGDTFDLPEGARLLASTPLTPHQAFMWGTKALALQFHPEVDATAVERWLIGHTCELAQGGFDPNALRADSARFGAGLRLKSRLVLEEWLETALTA